MILGIYGASGLGREILENVQMQPNFISRWEQVFFIDDIQPDRKLCNYCVLSFEQICALYSSAQIEFIIAVGEPFLREKLYHKVKSFGYSLTTLVHPSAILTNSTILKEGVIVNAFSFVSCDVFLDCNALIQNHVSIGHDTKIGSHCVISAGDMIGGHSYVGSRTYISMGISIKDRISIGSDSILGLGSVVTQNIPDNVIAMGNPARGLKHNDDHQVFRS
ncbi:MAG: NeuD/PglB/VioB family sugar acetyltransferase [Anaerovorax sp.]